MHDCKLLDIRSAIVCTVVSIIPCIIPMNLMMSRKKSIKNSAFLLWAKKNVISFCNVK